MSTTDDREDRSQHASTPNQASKGPPRSARRRAREFALQGLYEWLLNPSDAGLIEANLRDTQGFHKADKAHFDILLTGIIREAPALTASIQPWLDRPVAELSPVEHAALLVGCYELTYCLDIPYRVVINEAVELAKTFGGVDGFKYVNGVLDKLAAQVRATETQAGRRN